MALRSKLSLRQRQTRNASTSTAATAAMISLADMTAEGTSARLGHERARQGGGRGVGLGAIREEAEAGRARPAHSRAERAQRLRVEVLAPALEPVELGVDRAGRKALLVRQEHRGERWEAERLDPLAGALH